MVREEIYKIKQEYEAMNIELVLCHNDPLCENFVKGSDKMYLVDWEYAGMNDFYWDIADLFIEAGYTAKEEEIFCQFYFGPSLSIVDKRRMLMNKIFLDFLWSLWGKQRYSCGYDLQDYANERYERAKDNLQRLQVTKINNCI